MNQITSLKLYDTDYYQWTMEQVQALKGRNFNSLDWENIIEEIEALGRSEYNTVVNLLMRQIEHRLKIDYVSLPECRNKWKAEIIAFRDGMLRKFAPSMKPKLEKEFEKIYKVASKIVETEYEISLPKECPYTLKELLSDDLLPY